MSISWNLPYTDQKYKWEWGSSPQVFTIGTSPQLILAESNEPRLISYRAEGSPDIKIKIWKNSPASGEHEEDSFTGHNMTDRELNSALKMATDSGTAKIIINTATKVVI